MRRREEKRKKTKRKKTKIDGERRKRRNENRREKKRELLPVIKYVDMALSLALRFNSWIKQSDRLKSFGKINPSK